MIMTIVWLCLAFFAGLALYIVTPWTAAKIAGDDWVETVSSGYVWLAQTAATKSAIVERDGTLELVSKRFDSEILGDKDKEHGDPRHHQDSFSVLSRLKNKSFGVALGSKAEYVSPLLAELGKEAWNAKENDELGKGDQVVESDDGKKKKQSTMRDGILVDKESKLVDLSRAKHLTTGNADPEDGHESYLWTEISQEKFNEKLSFGQSMIIVLGALGSMVAMFYLTSQTGGTASGGGGGGGGGATAQAVNNSTTVSMLFLFAALSGFGLENLKDGARKAGAIVWVLGWIVTWPLTAFIFEGLLMSVIVLVVMTAVALVLPIGITLAGPSIPKSIGLILARGHWILAQLTVDRGILVRRSTGEYEYHKLYEPDPTVEETITADLVPGQRVDGDREVGIGWQAQYDDHNDVVDLELEINEDIETISTASLSVIAHGEDRSETIFEESFNDVGRIEERITLPATTESEDTLPSSSADEFDSLAPDDELQMITDVEIRFDLTVREDLDYDFITSLADGSELEVHGSEGDLYRFGWAPLGITEEKGRKNMGPITQTPPSDIQTDGGRIAPNNTRQGYRPLLKIPDQDQWLVTLPQLWSWCQGAAESETIEQGRDKALSEHGGAQQVGMAIFSVVVLASVVIGGLFGWLAAGGLG